MHTNKWLYKNIHMKHHEIKQPLSLDILYASFSEIIIVSLSSFLAMFTLGGINLYTFIFFMIIKQFHEISIHSGVKSHELFNYIPFYGLNQYHDNHHKLLKGNYSSTFCIWDKVFNTFIN